MEGPCSSAMTQRMKAYATYLRKIDSELLMVGLIGAREELDSGYKLRFLASEISLADVYEALGKGKPSHLAIERSL